MPANHNVPHTEEAKRKMSEARKGIPQPAKRREIRVIDSVEYFHCGTCEEFLPRDGFYANKRTVLGIKSECKTCHTRRSIATRDVSKARDANREYVARSRKRNPEVFRERERKYSRNRVKDKKWQARYELNLAVRRGDVIRAERCEQCQAETKLAAHHDDYDMALVVRWLCNSCHGKEHRRG